MKKIYFALLLGMVSLAILSGSCAHAQALDPQKPLKLGIEVKQGVSPYVKDIDPNGLAASAGMMSGDYIMEIDNVAVWYIHQVKGQLSIKKTDKPVQVVVKRNGTLHTLTIDPAKPAKTWRVIKDGDPLADCYLAPTAECVLETMLKSAFDSNQPKDRFIAHTSNIDRLVQMNRMDIAVSEYEKAEEAFYQLADIKYDYPSMLRAQSVLKKKPDQKFLTYTRSKVSSDRGGAIDTNGLLYAAQYFGEYGHTDSAMPYLTDVIEAAKKSPKILKFDARSLGRALAATGRHDLIKTFLESKDYDSEWKTKMLEDALIFHVKQEQMKDGEEILKIILSYPRQKTNKDDILVIRMLKKLQQDDLMFSLTDQLTKHTEKMDPLFRGLLARTLVQAHGARGSIHMGRKVIEQYFSKDPLAPLIDLTVDSANSRSAIGLAVQFYRDMPKLISETYALLKNTDMEERKRNKLEIRKFYEVLAADLNSAFSRQEFDSYGYDSFDYDQIIDIFIEVRKYDEALEWTVEQERRFGKSYNYHDLFSMYGQAAPPEKMEQIKKHSKFKEHGDFFNRAYLKRLYWNGRIEEAAALFKTLSDKEKKIMIFSQIPFVSQCLKCDL